MFPLILPFVLAAFVACMVPMIFHMSAVHQAAENGCPTATFRGDVRAGHPFQKDFAEGLVFRLVSEGDAVTPGWTIQIHEKSDTERKRDFLMIATPPYRFWNPRYLNVSYGYSAQESVAIRIREFSFVPNRKEFDRFANAVGKVLWSYGHPQQEVKQATEIVLNAPRCPGRLRFWTRELRIPRMVAAELRG